MAARSEPGGGRIIVSIGGACQDFSMHVHDSERQYHPSALEMVSKCVLGMKNQRSMMFGSENYIIKCTMVSLMQSPSGQRELMR